jgi:F-type H+-transporting ATPase subunit a
MKLNAVLPYLIIALILIGVGVFVPIARPVVSISAEHLFSLGPLNITNSLLTAWIVTIVIILLVFVGTRKMELLPSGLQNFLEFLVEGLYNLTESVAGPKWVSKFFVVPATIFIFVLGANLFGLFISIPLTGFGLCEGEHEAAHEEAAASEEHPAETQAETGRLLFTCAPGQHIVPLFRAPSADLNFTFALAIITQILAQVFGFMALGAGYLGKFFVFDKIRAAKSGGEFALGLIDVFVGLLELLSEFIKVIAFTFRLFGNIFAGEVMLAVIVFLVPLIVITPLIGFEIFVAFIQAFVFYILSVAFYRVAVAGHGDHDEAH